MAARWAAVRAEAAPARVRFQIEPKPYAEALLDLAQQANVTLIGAGGLRRRGARRPVTAP